MILYYYSFSKEHLIYSLFICLINSFIICDFINNSKIMDLKILNIDKSRNNENENDISIDIEDTTYFSYPYFVKNDDINDIEYLFRIKINNNNVILDEVENDNNLDFNNITTIKHICSITYDKLQEHLLNSIDLRDNKTKLEEGVVQFNINNDQNRDSIIEKNKIYVLYELFNSLIE